MCSYRSYRGTDLFIAIAKNDGHDLFVVSVCDLI